MRVPMRTHREPPRGRRKPRRRWPLATPFLIGGALWVPIILLLNWCSQR